MIIYRAESWDQYINDLRNLEVLPAWKGSEASLETSDYRTRWAGSETYEDAVRLAVEGDPITTEALDVEVVKHRNEAEQVWDLAPVGVMPCIPAHAAGVPEDMLVLIEQDHARPVIKIAVNIGASASVDPEHIIYRGAALVALIDHIQSKGARVELVAVTHSHFANGGKAKMITEVVVKRPEEPIDIGRVAYALAHPSMLRRLTFRLTETHVPFYSSGYGSPQHWADKVDADIVLGEMDTKSYATREQALATVMAQWEGG